MVTVKLETRFLSSPLPASVNYTQEGKFILLELEPGRSILDIIQSRELQFTQPMVALINDTTADMAEELRAGDRVRLLPQIAGGSF